MTTLKQMRKKIQDHDVFKGNSVYSRWVSPTRYAVFSYGEHFPMAVWNEGEGWLLNADKFSPTTGRHQSMVRGAVGDASAVPTQVLIAMCKGE